MWQEAYTRVLMGHVDLARLVIPRSVRDTRTDLAARSPLYSVGLDYLHGTGHGIGSFLGVHESKLIRKLNLIKLIHELNKVPLTSASAVTRKTGSRRIISSLTVNTFYFHLLHFSN